VPFEQNWVDPDTRRKLRAGTVKDSAGMALKPRAELAKVFEKLDPAKETIVYCQSGNRAAQSAAVLAELGFKNVRVYDSSWLGYSSWLSAPADDEVWTNFGSLPTTIKGLEWVSRFLSFHGSLMVFRLPNLTRRLLVRARELSGYEDVRELLYWATCPQTTSWSNGTLAKEDDYVETEAIKAAETHANDPELLSFFGWIAERVQAEKRKARADHELRMRDWED